MALPCVRMSRGKPTTHKRQQGEAVLVRMRDIEKRYLEAAAKRKTADISRDTPGATVGLGPLLRGGGLRWAEQILGLTIEEFETQEKRGHGNGGRK